MEDETAPLVPGDRHDTDSILDHTDTGLPGFEAGSDIGDLAETKSSWYLFMLTLSIGG